MTLLWIKNGRKDQSKSNDVNAMVSQKQWNLRMTFFSAKMQYSRSCFLLGHRPAKGLKKKML